jgi:hypothetical protein
MLEEFEGWFVRAPGMVGDRAFKSSVYVCAFTLKHGGTPV